MKKAFLGFLILLSIISCSNKEEPLIQYSLKTKVIPLEGGTISSPSSILDEGTEITLKAIPSPDFIFYRWSGDASSDKNPLTLVMTTDKEIKAVFKIKRFSLKIDIEGGGTVKQEIIQGDFNTDYAIGSTVKLTAVPREGWEFTGWSGDFQSNDTLIEITIDKQKSIKAIFKKKIFSLQIDIEGEGDVKDEIIQGEFNNGYTFKSIVKLTAVPKEGWEFIGWDGDSQGHDISIEVTIDKAKNIKAIFIDRSKLTFIPDENFEKSLIQSGYDDVVNGFVITKNIKLITELSIKNLDYPVNDLTGIEDFESLESLLLHSMPMPSLDFSNNKNLTKLTIISSNFSSPLDLTNNLNLKELTVSYTSYYFSSLNLSNNKNLEKLNVSHSYLTSLDVTNLPKLKELDISVSGIKSIDLSKNMDLEVLNAGGGGGTNQKISSIDVSKNINLKHLDLGNNGELKSLNVLNNLKLEYLDLSGDYNGQSISSIDLSNNNNLKHLNVSNNNLNTIDVSHMLNLEYLNTFGNKYLTFIDVSKNINLKHLDLGDNRELKSLNVLNNLKLEYLDLRGNYNGQSIDLSNNNNLKHLNVSNTYLSTIDVSHMLNLEYLNTFGNRHLTFIDVSKNLKLIDLNTSGAENTCVKVNQEQLNDIPTTWISTGQVRYALDCN